MYFRPKTDAVLHIDPYLSFQKVGMVGRSTWSVVDNHLHHQVEGSGSFRGYKHESFCLPDHSAFVHPAHKSQLYEAVGHGCKRGLFLGVLTFREFFWRVASLSLQTWDQGTKPAEANEGNVPQASRCICRYLNASNMCRKWLLQHLFCLGPRPVSACGEESFPSGPKTGKLFCSFKFACLLYTRDMMHLAMLVRYDAPSKN